MGAARPSTALSAAPRTPVARDGDRPARKRPKTLCENEPASDGGDFMDDEGMFALLRTSRANAGGRTVFDSRRVFLAVGLILVISGAALTTSSEATTASDWFWVGKSELGKGYYSTNTPYEPQQNLRSYEPAPEGYAAVFMQMVARHGSRALTSSHDIDFIKQLLAYALADNAFTALGRKLEPQVVSLEEANVALGYGNLSGRGVEEHQQLAARLLARLPDLFSGAVEAGRHIIVVNSGKDRAVDSGNDFAASLAAHMPALAPLIDPPVSNPDLLYFHKAPQNKDYQDWLAHDPTLLAKLDSSFYSERSHRRARQLLGRLFSASLVAKLAAGRSTFKDPKTGAPVVLNDVDIAASLYSLYQVAPGLSEEGTWDFDQFVRGSPARWFAYLNDADEFYEKGPSFAHSTITFKMAKVLQDDSFNAVEAVLNHSCTLVADLRFAHAEIVIPLAALMQLPYSDEQVPVAKTYTHGNNPWRGALVTPYAVNIQWDVYTNASGDYLVRMLYNERQMRFKSTYKSIRPRSYYYSFDELKRCYGYQ